LATYDRINLTCDSAAQNLLSALIDFIAHSLLGRPAASLNLETEVQSTESSTMDASGNAIG
jgi:hypothetical protein